MEILIIVTCLIGLLYGLNELPQMLAVFIIFFSYYFICWNVIGIVHLFFSEIILAIRNFYFKISIHLNHIENIYFNKNAYLKKKQ